MKTLAALARSPLALVMLVALAAAARLWNIGVSEYRFDEALLSGLAYDVLDGRPPATGLPASLDIPLPPTMAYMMAIPYAFTDDPLLVTACIALYNALGVLLLYALCRRYLAPEAAFVIALLYALSPWALVYSRKIWVPNLHTPFLLAGLLLGFRGFTDGKRWAQALTLPLLTLPIHFHYSAVALLPLYGYLLWRGRARIAWGAVAASVGLSLVLLIPFAPALPEVIAAVGRVLETRSAGGLQPTLEPWAILASYAAGTGVDARLLGASTADPLVLLVGAAFGLLTLVGLVVFRRGRHTPLLLMWALLPALSLTPGWTTVFDHYLNLSLPAVLILTGSGAHALAEVISAGWRPAVYAALALGLALQFGAWARLLDVLDSRSLASFSTPLYRMNAARAALRPVRDVLIFNADLVHSAWTWEPLLRRQADCVREVIIAEGGVVVRPRGRYAAFMGTDISAYPLLSTYETQDTLVLPNRQGEAPFRIDLRDTPPAWDAPTSALTPARFSSGAVLTGIGREGGQVYLDWTLTRGDAPDYQYFIHAYDAAGERVAQRDTSFYAGRYWCEGDRITTWIDLALPAAAASLRVGMYRLGEGGIEGVDVLDDAGSAAPWVDIPLSGLP